MVGRHARDLTRQNAAPGQFEVMGQREAIQMRHGPHRRVGCPGRMEVEATRQFLHASAQGPFVEVASDHHGKVVGLQHAVQLPQLLVAIAAHQGQMRPGHAKPPLDLDRDGAARLQRRQLEPRHVGYRQPAPHQHGIAVPAERDVIDRQRRGDEVGVLRDHPRGQGGGARAQAPVRLLQDDDIRAEADDDFDHPARITPPVAAHGLAYVVACEFHVLPDHMVPQRTN
tara:strand:+ start:6463 stop:7143 length:681 start_codon:yes stop_codon:yes gene_type:complete